VFAPKLTLRENCSRQYRRRSADPARWKGESPPPSLRRPTAPALAAGVHEHRLTGGKRGAAIRTGAIEKLVQVIFETTSHLLCSFGESEKAGRSERELRVLAA